MTTSIGGTTGITFNDASVQNTAATGFGFKNRIINGAMVIDQRNAGASVTVTGTNYSVDRWVAYASVTSKFTVQQNAGSVTPPAGFSNYLGATSSSSYTVGASEYYSINQALEGFNTADLGWGTANAQAVTLSFWVRSSLTGTFGGAIQNYARSRSYPFSFTISSANTWEQKTVTIAGDTAGTWVGASNAGSVYVIFSVGTGATISGAAGSWSGSNFQSVTGATSVVGTSGATFYITGVQLEKGSTATSFDYRPYGTELALCQRYGFAVNGSYTGFANGTTTVDAACMFPVTMRANPTLTAGTAVMTAYGAGGSFAQSSVSSSLPSGVTQNGCGLRFNNFTGLTANSVYVVNNAATGAVTAYSSFLSAEL
jgi:hypothetical protein